MTFIEMTFILMAYLLGGICMGYYLVRFKTGEDIRKQGSGGVGGRNVARILGTPGFVITSSWDTLKGILAVLLARHFGAPEPVVALVLIAVISGHVWPWPLRFHGGRGIATGIGAYLAYSPMLALLFFAILFVLMGLRRGITFSGLMGFLLLPIAAWLLDQPGYTVAAFSGAGVIILFAHRERIRKALGEIRHQREV